MASPIKDGGPSQLAVIDTLMALEPDPELDAAMEQRKAMFDVRVRAVDIVRRDRRLPKYQRLGMLRIAQMEHVAVKTLYEWRGAYERGGVDALQSRPGDRGRKSDVSRETLVEARDTLLARNPQAEAAKNMDAAKKSRNAGGEAADREEGRQARQAASALPA